MKNLITLFLISIGAYLLLSRREAKAEEIPKMPAEIPATPEAPENPAINMVDQILKELEWAKEKIAKLEEEAKPLRIKGDINGDGIVNSADAILCQRFVAGLQQPTPEQFWAADMDNDGKITDNDAQLILQKAVGLFDKNSEEFIPVTTEEVPAEKVIAEQIISRFPFGPIPIQILEALKEAPFVRLPIIRFFGNRFNST